jgi:hypothetical protein
MSESSTGDNLKTSNGSEKVEVANDPIAKQQ